MKRYMVDPLNFGTQSGYPWSATDALIQPHSDYVKTYTLDHSIRLWEPARWSLGAEEAAGLMQLEQGALGQTADLPGAIGVLVDPDPQPVEIHGFKGDIWLQMAHFIPPAGGIEPNPLGEWTDETGAPLEVTDADSWAALGGGDVEVGVSGRAPGLSCPVFITMYRGTYRQLDDLTGWEIDSGPPDDPDTLLGVDISSPTVLESARMDWWTRVECPFPRLKWEFTGATPTTVTSVERTQTIVKVPMDLSRNVRLAANQVLWLHIRTGVVRAWVNAGPAGAKEDVPGLYRNHSFHCWNCMSALVTAKRRG